MDKIEIIIGRQVGKDDFKVEEQYKAVSRRHARIFRAPEGFFIEDLGSSCGTFVNGSRVVKKRIAPSDRISLGGADYYELNLNKILEKFPLSDVEFSEKFLALKEVYENFVKEKIDIQKKGQRKMTIKRTAPMALAYLIPFVGRSIGMAASSAMTANDSGKILEQVAELQERFLEAYCCPACYHSFGQTPWVLLKKQGKCPRCKREWNVD